MISDIRRLWGLLRERHEDRDNVITDAAHAALVGLLAYLSPRIGVAILLAAIWWLVLTLKRYIDAAHELNEERWRRRWE